MMYEELLNVNENHKLVQTNTKWEQRKGWDTDTYWFDEFNENGELVAKYIVKDETCIYPPFEHNVSYSQQKI